ncbi:helix-turn-helix domain-containing protein [Ruegeria sediminis]|uniref:helix-turn-helix domain-containing protein n=1 Tax=Ruegeria sediminis TaxID=2583820 RepID=UPI001FE64D6D|nr:AraC family transcriptional regulator [Ruegeria sediminis]
MTSFLEKSGGSPEVVARVLKVCDLSEQDIAPPAKLFSARKEALFVRGACDALKDITFGARAGLAFKHSSSLTAYINKYSRDLREVLENTSRFHDIIDPAIAFSLRISGNFATFEAEWKDASFARYHRRTEFLFFGSLARARTICQSDFFPIEMRLQHEVGQAADKFRKLAGFPVVFGAEKMEIILSHSTLAMPIPTYDARLQEHLVEYGERLLADRRSQPLALRAKVEGLIVSSMPGRVIPADEAAASLGMSSRTFARRLRDEGVNYRDIVDDLRCDLARTFIKNGMNLSEISFTLGYSDQAAFSTAFKRWTGQPPKVFRDSAARQGET